jgi:hypothetical protein
MTTLFNNTLKKPIKSQLNKIKVFLKQKKRRKDIFFIYLYIYIYSILFNRLRLKKLGKKTKIRQKIYLST